MEIAFLDTSASVKRYHNEEYSDLVNEIFRKYAIVISELSLVELTSAINRKALDGVLSEEDFLTILNFFRKDLANFTILRFDTNVINSAIEIVIKHNLKTLDALQLAFAMRIKDYKPLFISFDEKLSRAAKKEGFKVIDI
jgi:predicted nucleic acid-binding protein